MSETELYEIARARIDRRNRRWTLWAIDLVGLMGSLAALILLNTDLTAAVFMGWIGVFAFHTIVAWLATSRENDIESEVAKLREAVYEKPKRLEVSDDGELVEQEGWEYEEEREQSHLS